MEKSISKSWQGKLMEKRQPKSVETKEKMSLAKFVQCSMREEFRNEYYHDLDRLKIAYDISNNVLNELKNLDLFELETTIQGTDFGRIGDMSSSHTQDDHMSHNQGDHSQDSHDDDRGSIVENIHIWRDLVTKYADNVSTKFMINLEKGR